MGLYLEYGNIGSGRPGAGEGDEAGGTKWQWAFSDLREGVADIAQIVQDFVDVGYEGYLSLEEFGPGDDAEKLRGQGAYLRKLIGGGSRRFGGCGR